MNPSGKLLLLIGGSCPAPSYAATAAEAAARRMRSWSRRIRPIIAATPMKWEELGGWDLGAGTGSALLGEENPNSGMAPFIYGLCVWHVCPTRRDVIFPYFTSVDQVVTIIVKKSRFEKASQKGHLETWSICSIVL
jgi:hypothetical protein